MIIAEKTAIIAGGTKGIGKEIAISLAQKGVKICCIYKQDKKAAEEFKKIIQDISSDFLVIHGDISDYETVKKCFQKTIDTFGNVDILINCARLYINKDDTSHITKKYRQVFETNVYAAAYIMDVFSQYFQGDIGKIINISSIAGVAPFTYRGGIDTPEYSCSKAAVNMLTQIMAKNLSGKILVNAIAPGATDTGGKYERVETLTEIANDSTINRLIRPSEIAHTVIFVLENDAMNGEIITIDGGTTFS